MLAAARCKGHEKGWMEGGLGGEYPARKRVRIPMSSFIFCVWTYLWSLLCRDGAGGDNVAVVSADGDAALGGLGSDGRHG